MKVTLLAAWIAFSFSFTSMADEPVTLLGGRPAPLLPLDFGLNDHVEVDDYRIGDEFGKHPAVLGESDEVALLDRTLKATAKVGGGTGFYLGKFGGEHVMATNYHVCQAAWSCSFRPVRFTAMNDRASFGRWIGSWTDIDLALFTIRPDAELAQKLEGLGMNFDYNNALYPGQPLYTAGYGIAGNTARSLMVNYDLDCSVFSDSAEFRFMADPDELNTGSYMAWSFANGCDVSHGDSGSAMVDRETGAVVGIIWTGKIPKSSIVKDSTFLTDVLESRNNDVIWTELSYSVPSKKIGEHLAHLISTGELSGWKSTVVGEMLSTELEPHCPPCRTVH